VKRALLIEDAPEYQLLIKAALREDFQVKCAGDAVEAIESLSKDEFDLILIDIGLPGRDGLSICEQLRRDSSLAAVPILFISGRNDPKDLAQGFAAGADDYIYKPFHPDELKTRIDARMKRAAAAVQAPQDEIKRADLQFLVGRQKVAQIAVDRSARDLNLTPNEFKILYHLARNEGRTLTRADILREVWGQDLHVVERTVDKHVCSLRRKMGSAAEYLVSVPGQGYVFRGKQRFSAAN
jgi:DNA-binding response OmpR family regulator